MRPDAFVIFPGDETWRLRSASGVDELRFEPDADAAHTAAAVAAKLRDRGYAGQGVLLALPSAWCLAARIATADLPRQDRTAMTFRLEEKLPLAAESFTADFAEFEGGALGVCVANDRILPRVAALEAAGVMVQSVSPAAMLAAQATAEDDDPRVILWGEQDRVNVITVCGHPRSWSLVEAGAVGRELDTLLLDAIDFEARDLPPGLRPSSAALPESIEDAVARNAPDLLSGRLRPWFELRRGGLAADDPLRVVRRAANTALVAAIAFCVTLAAVFLLRAARYDRLARSYEDQAAAEFRSQFPTWPVPANVRAVVESERRRLTLAGGSSLPAQAQTSALHLLREVLSKLPSDAPVAFDRLAFHDTVLELEGRARANGDVDVLVASARAAGLDVAPPQLRKTADGTWGFVVRGTRPGNPGATSGATAGGGE
jgi:hypothetical protein